MRTIMAMTAVMIGGLSLTVTAGSLQMGGTSKQLQVRLNKAIHDKSAEEVKDLSIALLAVEQSRFAMKGNEAIEGFAPNPRVLGKVGRLAVQQWLSNEGSLSDRQATIIARLFSKALDGSMDPQTRRLLDKEKEEKEE